MYDEDILIYWMNIYQNNIQWNFDNLILKNLTESERRQVGKVNLRFTIYDGVRSQSNLFATDYSLKPAEIILPIFTIKFFDDLSVAFSKQSVNGQDDNSILEYIAVLKYNSLDKFSNNQYPSPIQAFQIPNDAIDDPNIDRIAQNNLKSWLLFELAHQLGHIYFHHTQAQRNIDYTKKLLYEYKADRFAIELMRRIGIAPVGYLWSLTVQSFWMPNPIDFLRNERAYQQYVRDNVSHPVSSDRIWEIANQLDQDARDFLKYEDDKYAGLEKIKMFSKMVSDVSVLMNDWEALSEIRQKALDSIK